MFFCVDDPAEGRAYGMTILHVGGVLKYEC